MVAKTDLSDTFQRTDGVLSGSSQKTADSNHEWTTSGAHVNDIANNFLTMQSVKTISSITSVGTTATVTCTGHGLVNDLGVSENRSKTLIAGANESAYNGEFLATYVDANTYTYTFAGTGGAPATGGLTQTATGNGGGGYAYIDLQTTPKRMSATFRFTDAEVGTSTSTNSAALVFIASIHQNATKRLEHMIHFKVTMAGWAFQYREYAQGGTWPFLSQGNWDTTLSKDTDYTFTIELNGPTIKAHCPDGSIKEVTLARMPTIYGPYLVYQTAYSTDNNDPKILVSKVTANNSLRAFV